MTVRVEVMLSPRQRGIHLVTKDVERALRESGAELPEVGICNVFCPHTSCGITACEGWDPSVRIDMAADLDRLIPDGAPYYRHVLEGPDDMASHTKSVLTGCSLTVPITRGKLDLGTWQGIYLCEFRDHGGPRKLIVTVLG